MTTTSAAPGSSSTAAPAEVVRAFLLALEASDLDAALKLLDEDVRYINYVCKGTQDGLWGGPIRNHEPWTIYAAIPHAKKLSKTVAIKSAWF